MHAEQTKIVERIIASLEQGVMPWRNQFKASRSQTGLPYNAISGASYRGFNVVALLMTGRPIDGGWLTYKQAIAAGGHVRKGERSTIIFYYSKMKKSEDRKKIKEGKDEYYLMAKSYLVFHLEQCESIDPEKLYQFGGKKRADVLDASGRNPTADAFISATNAKIEYTAATTKAAYYPLKDMVRMPLFEQFESVDAYYSIHLHELAHWTGPRLGRNVLNKFGDEKYAMEELIAELTSCFTLPQFGMNNEVNNAAYFDGWIKCLKETPAILTKVASEAAKANAFLNAFSQIDETKALQDDDEEIAQAA